MPLLGACVLQKFSELLMAYISKSSETLRSLVGDQDSPKISIFKTRCIVSDLDKFSSPKALPIKTTLHAPHRSPASELATGSPYPLHLR